ncbi:MAG TPA: hypothetical protein VIP58_05685 [Nocardioides sp.]
MGIRIDLTLRVPIEPLLGSPSELSRVDGGGSEHAGDGVVRIVEAFAKQVSRQLGGAQPGHQLTQHLLDDRCLLDFAKRVLDGSAEIGERQVGRHLMAVPGRLDDVDRQMSRGRSQERSRILDIAPVGPLPAEPCVLDHILGIGDITGHTSRDAEQLGPHREKDLESSVQVVAGF